MSNYQTISFDSITDHFPITNCLFSSNYQSVFSIVWGIVYNRGMRHRGTLRRLNNLALPQSPLHATPLKLYVYIVNFFREVCNTPSIIYQMIYISLWFDWIRELPQGVYSEQLIVYIQSILYKSGIQFLVHGCSPDWK